MKLLQKNDHGLSLIETVVAIALVAILGTAGIVTYSFFKEAFLKDEINAIATTGYSKALNADTGFDEETSAETVIAEMAEDFPEFEMRTSGEGYEDLCVFVSHGDLPDHESIVGNCVEVELRNRPPSAPRIAVQNLQCFDHTTDDSLHSRQFKLTWEAPAILQDRDVVYTVKWIDHITSVEGEVKTTETEYIHTAPRMNEIGMHFTPSTELLIIPSVDETTFESTGFVSYDDGSISNTRLCGGGDS